MIRMLITNAGRQALLNAEQTGTNAVTIARIGVGSGRYTPSLNQTELQQETKRLNIIEGGATGDNAFHVAYRDESDDAYSIYEFGLYLDNGILFAVYSSSDLVMQKSASSTAMLVVDVALEDVSTSQITFGSVTYEVAGATSSNAGVVTLATEQDVANGEAVNLAITPAVLGARTATETRTGLIELATVAEAQAGADAVRAITPATAKAIIDYRLASSADTITGASTTKAVTPAGLTARTATTGRTGLVELATEAETLAGTDELKAITPKTLKSAISNVTQDASGYYEWDISSIVATAKDKGVTEVKFVAVDENNKHQSGDVVLTFADDVGSIYEVGEDGKATIIGKLEESAVKSGVTYGVRYREAMVLESAYLRKKIADLEARIVALETA